MSLDAPVHTQPLHYGNCHMTDTVEEFPVRAWVEGQPSVHTHVRLTTREDIEHVRIHTVAISQGTAYWSRETLLPITTTMATIRETMEQHATEAQHAIEGVPL